MARAPIETSAPAKRTPAKKAAPAPRTTSTRASRGGTRTAPGDMNVESFLGALRQQESGGNYTSRSRSSSASGAYQYIDSTWNHYGGYAHAWQAPAAVQDARARADVQASLKKYGGDWRKVAAAHFAGPGWVDKHPDPSTWDQNPVPGSNNPTVAQYVAGVFSKAGVATDSSGALVHASATSGPAPVGGVNDTSNSYALPPNATDQQIKDFVGANYGYLVGFLHNAEIGPILIQAAKEGWDQARLAGRLSQTNYWKQTSASARTWDAQTLTDPATQHAQVTTQMSALADEAKKLGVVISGLKLHDLAVTSLRLGWNSTQIDAGLRAQGALDSRPQTARDYDEMQKNDPATLHQSVQTQAGKIQQQAQKLGVTLTDLQAHDIAVNSLRLGWDDSRINTELMARGIVDPNHPGAIQSNISALRTQATAYMVPVSDATLAQWGKDIAAGKFSSDDFTTYLKEQAKSLFPGLSSAIDRGVTVKQYTDPYRQIAAQTLEINPEDVDFLQDPRFNKALFSVDPKTGQRVQMSLADFQSYMRTLPDYQKTSQANDQAAQFATLLTKTFGKVA